MSINPMQCGRVSPHIDRAYASGSRFLWARETLVNAVEAGASRVEFTVDWQSAARGVYRRLICDNGSGMSEEEMRRFLNRFGEGDKPLGPRNENFGVGAKTSLLPWNRRGVIYASWKNGVGSMMRLQWDATRQEYGASRYEAVDRHGNHMFQDVVEPGYDADFDVNLADMKPDWIGFNGTIILLLGGDANEDTINGDSRRDEGAIRPLAQYLNERFWDITQEGRIEVKMLEFAKVGKNDWPRAASETSKYQMRSIFGTKYYATLPSAAPQSGEMTLKDGVTLKWYLWAPTATRRGDYGPGKNSATVSVKLLNELYEVKTSHMTYRKFGIGEEAVRRRLYLMICPPVWDDATQSGAYPQPDRVKLRWGVNAEDLPMDEWAEEFRNNMPQAIVTALRAARSDAIADLVTDQALAERISQCIGKMRVPVYRPATNAAEHAAEDVSPTTQQEEEPPPDSEYRLKGGGRPSGSHRDNVTALPRRGHKLPAAKEHKSIGMPGFRLVHEPFDDRNTIAMWTPPSADEPNGYIQFWWENPVVTTVLEYLREEFSGYDPEEVRKAAEAAFQAELTTKAAHVYTAYPDRAADMLLNGEALSIAAMGLMGITGLVSTTLLARPGSRRASAR